ncbi:MAG: DNA polymerase III subunit chi [Pseudoprimorskyibacter sp.]|nr:DNA polymerase III subunit chi [Pseudoprimorskyibacter sp.]
MGAAYFYHLMRRSVDAALTELLARSLERDWRVQVRCGDASRIEWWDQKLWLGPEDGFLPHGIAGGTHDTHQPVLLTTATDAPVDRAVLLAVDGARITSQDIAATDRACLLFAAADEDAVQMARDQWRDLTKIGTAAQYWSDEGGRWEMKAERAAVSGLD